jgi:hypothetical protein
LAAIQKNGYAIKYVENPTPRVLDIYRQLYL